MKAGSEFDKFEIKRRAREDAKADAEFAKQVEILARQTKQLAPKMRRPKKK